LTPTKWQQILDELLARWQHGAESSRLVSPSRAARIRAAKSAIMESSEDAGARPGRRDHTAEGLPPAML
jgi:hypothetical protein